ncbi:MAG: hypothetical protein ACRCYE_06355 [Sarcina sp.]
MEETIKAPTAVFVGKIDNIMYVNLTHEKGFTEDTKIDVTDEFLTELKTDIVSNLTKYDNTNKTLKITVTSSKLDPNYFITITDADGTQTVVTIDTTIEPDALITNNVKVTSHGDRIIEILFDEPVQNLRSSFDFAIDRYNSSELVKKNVYVITAGNNSSYAGKQLLECTVTDGVTVQNFFLVEESPTRYLEVTSSGEIGTTYIRPDLNSVKPAQGFGITNYYTLTREITVTHSRNNATTTKGIIRYESPFKLSESPSSILLNFYFRYFGTDDEGTLYTPTTTPLDWLGYFASKDTEIHVSDDNRRFEIEFPFYSLPTGDTHELIINYAKTFPGYNNKSRIKDSSDNSFPIVSKTVPIVKDSKKASIIDVKSLSKTEFEITFDKPVLCIGHEVNQFELLLNGKTLENVRRSGVGFNKLIGKFSIQNALELGPTEITVGSITDACGYKTNEQTFTITVIADPPRVINLVHKETTDINTTLLEIEFDDEMADPAKAIEEYITIFEVDSETGIETQIKPTLIFILGASSTTAELRITNPKLYYGRKYKINIEGLTNKVETVMIPYSEVLFIGDLTAPYIENIILTNDAEYSNSTDKQFRHKIVITYDEPMETQGAYSILNANNYMILGNAATVDWCIENTKKLALNNSLASISVPSYEKNSEDRRVIIKLNSDVLEENFDTTADYLNYFFGVDKHLVSAGYCDVKSVKYVTNDSGNVLNFSCLAPTEILNKINIGNLNGIAELTVIDAETLAVKFPKPLSNNEIMSISPSDFTIRKTVDGKNIDTPALDATILSSNTDYVITLRFAPNVLVPKTSLILTTGKTSDKFDNPVIFDSTPISTNIIDRVDLVNAKFINTSGHFAVIEMSFSDTVKLADIPSFVDPTTPTPQELQKLEASLEKAAHCFALKVGTKDWISLQTVLANLQGDPVTPTTIPTNTSTLYFLYDNASAIFDGTTAILATTSSQDKMKVLSSINNEPIQIIPVDNAQNVTWLD